MSVLSFFRAWFKQFHDSDDDEEPPSKKKTPRRPSVAIPGRARGGIELRVSGKRARKDPKP